MSRKKKAAAADQLMTRRDLAELVQGTERLIEDLDQRGEGPPRIVLGPRTIRYSRASVERWLAERTVSAAS